MPRDDWSIEQSLYPPFRFWQNVSYHQWLQVSGDHITAETANRRAIYGQNQTPDFLRFDMPKYRFSRTKELLVTSFEIKTNRASVVEVTDQVRAHTMLSNYAWAVLHNWTRTKLDNLNNDAREFGFGVLTIPDDPQSSGYAVEIEPTFHALSLHTVDNLVLTYLEATHHEQIEGWLSR